VTSRRSVSGAFMMGNPVAYAEILHRSGFGFEALNLGTGTGYSVKEVTKTGRRVTGEDIRYRIAGRMAGDPSRLVASAERARAELGWAPEYGGLAAIVETARRWFARPSPSPLHAGGAREKAAVGRVGKLFK